MTSANTSAPATAQTSDGKDSEKKPPVRLLRRLLRFLLPYKWWIALGLVVTIVSSALGPLRPRLVQLGIDNYIRAGNPHDLLNHCLLILGVLILQGVLQFTLTYLMQWVGQKALLDIRMVVFDHIQRLPLRVFDTTPVGRLVTRVTNDVEALNELFSSGVVLIINDILVLAWILGFMLSIQWELTLYTIAVLPFLLTAATIFRRNVRIVYGHIRVQIARMNSFLNEYITGVTTVQMFNQQKQQAAQFDEINAEHTRLQIQSISYYAIFFPVVEMLSSIAICTVLWYAGGHYLSGFMTIGTLVSFVMYAEMFFRPVRDLTEKYNTLQSAVTASERIFDLLDQPTEQTEQEASSLVTAGIPAQPLTTAIHVDHLNFSYTPDRPVLRDISFTVRKGEMVALVGATGSGKSTIINMLCGFYEYQSGSIRIDGTELRDLDRKSHRSRIALVLQDVFLFSRSVRDNILMGRTTITDEHMRTVAASIGADFIDSLPNGYDTQVMERGSTLSTGQKQLLSFARAIVSDPEIIILDEATASIDTETEQLIDRAMEKTLKGRTSIVIAHRLSTIQRADRIIVLHHGSIAEQGTHDELLRHKGLYSKLHRLQYAQPHMSAAPPAAPATV